MPKRPAPRGLRDDPRLVERRGDLRGLSALAFLVLLLAGFAIVAFLLLVVVRPGPAAATPSPSPSPTATPRPTARPTPTTAPTDIVPSGPIEVDLAEPAALVQGGRQVGTVTVSSAEFVPTLDGRAPPGGTRWLVVTVEYDATAALDYSASDWFALDKNGKRYPWHGANDPAPALGTGTLAAGKTRTGTVTLEAPAKLKVRQLVLTDGAGSDLVIVTIA